MSGRVVYLETSALMAAILEGDQEVQRLVEGEARLVTSALTLAESSRALVRAAATGRLTTAIELQAARLALDTVSGRLHVVPVSAGILARAGRAFPVEPVRTLDAIHLATTSALPRTRVPWAMRSPDVDRAIPSA